MNLENFNVPTKIPLDRFEDDRGYLEALLENKVSNHICIKRTISKLGVIRGFHWQNIVSPQSKLIFVLKGSIFDVTIKMEGSQPIKNSIVSETITEECKECIYVPHNYAHAYQALSNNSSVLYICFGKYNSKEEISINPLSLNIRWPIKDYSISDKDLSGVSCE